MEIDITLNVNTCVLLGIIGALGYGLYNQTRKVRLLSKENEVLKDMKGETGM